MFSTTSSPVLRSSYPRLQVSGKRPPKSPSSVRFRQLRVLALPPCASAERTRSSCLYPPKPARSCASPSLYEVLGIPVGASGREIKAAYRKLARIFHPDAAAIDRKGSSADQFMKIHAAYSTLSDPEKRADYDRKLILRYRSVGAYSVISASPASPVSRFSGYTRRNWETDQCW